MDEALGDPQGSSLVLQTVGAETYELDGKSAPAVFEMAQTGEDDEDPGDPGDPGEPGEPGEPGDPGGPGGPGGPDRWLDREYIWGPGDRGLDELLAQYDRHGLPSWPVQDQGADAIALLDLGGVDGAPRVVAEWVYDPYGKVVAADTILQELPSLRVGHKGLFVDRLDAAVDAPRLTANARILYHNRNRTAHPELGRFLQKDPNATAMVLLANEYHHGSSLTAGIDLFNLDGRYTDGANLYAYVGSNPIANSDPMGLFIGMTSFLIPGPSAMIGGAAASMVGEYAANQLWDADWALDWSMPDDMHSRLDNSWVAMSLGQGVYDSFGIGIGDYVINPLDAFAGANRASRAPRQNTRFKSPKVQSGGQLPNGWTYRIDTKGVHPNAGGFHIHIYSGSTEVAKVNGKGAWDKAHRGNNKLMRPSEVPKRVRNRINRIVRLTSVRIRYGI